MDIKIRRGGTADRRTAENIFRESFWDVYMPGTDEHLIAHRLWDHPAFIPELFFIASVGGEDVGAIVWSREKVESEDGRETEVATFGPVGVMPSLQKSGIGSALIRHTLPIAREMGFPAVFIFGDPDYYCRFGFENAAKLSVTTEFGDNPDPFMGLALDGEKAKLLCGAFIESEPFDVSDEELELFDASFPPKEKHEPEW